MSVPAHAGRLRSFPQALFLAGTVVLLAGLVWHLAAAWRPPHLLAALLVAAYLLWMLAELPVTAQPAAEPVDDPTLVPYGLARLGTVAAAVFGPLPWTRWSWWLAVPVVVFVAGALLRQAAVVTLGRFYSHVVVRQPDHQVQRGGPYALVRHPAYVGMLLGNVGFVAFFLNPASVVLLLVLAAAVVFRIRFEERMLYDLPGYREYAAGHARLIPGVW